MQTEITSTSDARPLSQGVYLWLSDLWAKGMMQQQSFFSDPDFKARVITPADTVEVIPRDPGFTPRDYQIQCIACIKHELANNLGTLAELSVGLGKTEIFIEFIRQELPRYGRIMYLAHTKELIA